MTRSLILGSSGFLGQHFCNYLKNKDHYVIGADRYPYTYDNDLQKPNEFYEIDLSNYENLESMLTSDIDEVYHFAAETGGVGYTHTNENDLQIMQNNFSITVNLMNILQNTQIRKVFYASSAAVYPVFNQFEYDEAGTAEENVLPASPDSEYGWEKLASERLLLQYADTDFDIRIGRLHSIFGPYCAWNNGRERAPAALCRKIAQTNDKVSIWSGDQSRSFLHVSEACEAIYLMMQKEYTEPLNIGASKRITLKHLAALIAKIADKKITLDNIPGPVGVNHRTSNNLNIEKHLNWKPNEDNFDAQLEELYQWIDKTQTTDPIDHRPI